MKNFLQDIITVKRREVDALKSKRPITEFIDSKRLSRGVRPFKEAISGGDKLNLIAEIKKKSPSFKRNFFRKLDIAGIASIYKSEGAKAMSVLTDKKFFSGNILHINEVKRTVDIPVLRKDFIIDEYQIYETVASGADALLLIADLLSANELVGFYNLATSLGLDVLIEVHKEEDIEKALATEGSIIGINNRDLHTFKTDLSITQKLIRLLPHGHTKVSESGIKSYEDVMFLKSIGVNAVLIGEAFMEAPDIALKVREVMRY